MRSYLIDEISPADRKKVIEYLEQNAFRSGLGDVFWVQVPSDLLSDIQSEHRECQPHAFAIEMGDTWVKIELFVRSLRDMRCECQAYASPQQQEFVIDFALKMIEELGIRT